MVIAGSPPDTLPRLDAEAAPAVLVASARRGSGAGLPGIVLDARCRWPWLGVVLISGCAAEPEELTLADRFLPKPFSGKALIQVVKELAEQADPCRPPVAACARLAQGGQHERHPDPRLGRRTRRSLTSCATSWPPPGSAPRAPARLRRPRRWWRAAAPGSGRWVLDVGLPDGDGRDLCARLRAAGLRVPVLMLTGSDAEADVVRGLEAGANDYVAQPCSAGVLVARLRAHLRLHENSVDAVFSLGPWQFHPAQKLLRDARGAKVWLTAKEVDILRYMQRSGGTVSKQALLSEVWGYNPSVSSHTLETHIYRLRQKIEADPYAARLLLTAEGGYQLAGA